MTTVGCNNGGPATAIETRITAHRQILGSAKPASRRAAGARAQRRRIVFGRRPRDRRVQRGRSDRQRRSVCRPGRDPQPTRPSRLVERLSKIRKPSRVPPLLWPDRAACRDQPPSRDFASAPSGRDNPAGQFPPRPAGLAGLSDVGAGRAGRGAKARRRRRSDLHRPLALQSAGQERSHHARSGFVGVSAAIVRRPAGPGCAALDVAEEK